MSFVDVGDLRLHVQRLRPKDGPSTSTIVLVHGILTDSLASYYFTLGPTLVAAGIDVVMYDQRGHGRSSRPDTGYALSDFVDDLVGVLDQLGIEHPVHLLGNSFGGTVAFALAARHPERVATVMVIEAEPPNAEWAEKMAGALNRAEVDLVDEPSLQWIVEECGAHTGRLARAAGRLLGATSIARDVPTGVMLTESEFTLIGCPVLAVYGEASHMVDRSSWLQALLPDCRNVFVRGQEHSVLIEEPGIVRELTLSWLADNGAELRDGSGEFPLLEDGLVAAKR